MGVCENWSENSGEFLFLNPFFPFFGRDFVGSKKIWRMANLLWGHTKLMGRYCVSWFSILWSRDFEWPCLPEGELPKTRTISKILIYSMISSSWNSVNDVRPPSFSWGAMLLFQRSHGICRFHGARETPFTSAAFLFFHPNIRSFRRQVLNCQLHVGLAPTEFTISEVGSIDEGSQGSQEMGSVHFLIKGSQAWVKIFFFRWNHIWGLFRNDFIKEG